MDIHSKKAYPANALSNFSPHPFIFRDFPVNSMEGFLQGLKFKNPDMQVHVFTLVGMSAKKKGANKNWYRDQTLWLMGHPIERKSDHYQVILDEAYESMFRQNEKAKNALLATGDAVLTHSIGKRKQNETVLTEHEFISRLTNIREKLKYGKL